MSLLLRKECQGLLDTYGLGGYHADIDENKYLSILGECGQPFITVHGISFHKFQPTRVEIEYAVELLDSFLLKHLDVLKKYLTKQVAFKAMKEPPYKGYNWVVGVSYGGKLSQIRYDDDIMKIDANSSSILNLTLNTSKGKASYPTSKIAKWQLDLDLHKEMMEHFKAVDTYKKLEKELEDIQSNLATCDI